MLKRFCLVLWIAFVPVAALAAADATDPTGWWYDQSKRAAVVISHCGDQLCGDLAWLRDPLNPKTGQPRTDGHNPDPALRGRLACGVRLLSGFVPDTEPGSWRDGRAYDPESGNTYHAELTLRPDGTLKLRGYIGIPLFGRSEIWTRPAENPPSCMKE